MFKKNVSQFFAVFQVFLLLILAVGLGSVNIIPVRAAPIKVMPLGDSITDGFTVPGGYRIQFYNRLVADGLTGALDFVGSQSNGPASLLDREHEGHTGWHVADIAANIDGWMASANPSIVMLMIGTNDILHSQYTGASTRLSALIDQICADLPAGGKLYVSTIPTLGSTTYGSYITLVDQYNADIPGIVQSKVAAGKPVYLVDMHSVISASDLSDEIHPSEAGYAKMGNAWYDIIKSNLTGGGTPIPTNTPTRTYTPGGPTPTFTSTVTPCANCGGSLKVQLASSGSDNNQQSAFNLKVMNTGTSAQSNISARLYFTPDGSNAASSYVLEKYYDQSGVATVSGPTLLSGSTYYFTVNFGSASLAAGNSWNFNTALHLNTWGTTYSGANDFWHTTGTLPSAFTDWPTIPAYISGALIWGSEPGGTGATNTPVVPTNTPTRTNTPSVPTNTPTRTNTPSVPTNTPTRTNTPSVPTNTPTRTNTPMGPTNTPTVTPVAPTNTPSVTVVADPWNCSPVTSVISAPFTYDGVGAFCWQSSNLGSYVNSWNLTSLAINGVNFTNVYVASGSYPAQIGGYWYVAYNGPYSWSHFEAK